MLSRLPCSFLTGFGTVKFKGLTFLVRVPPSAVSEELFAVFYDMDPQVKSWVLEHGLNSLVNSLEFGLVITPCQAQELIDIVDTLDVCLYAGGTLGGHASL